MKNQTVMTVFYTLFPENATGTGRFGEKGEPPRFFHALLHKNTGFAKNSLIFYVNLL
jgi:hypothetical protein